MVFLAVCCLINLVPNDCSLSPYSTNVRSAAVNACALFSTVKESESLQTVISNVYVTGF